MSKDIFYTGSGVLHHNGKDYGFGAALPADLPAETVAALLKKKKASTTKPAGPRAAADDGAEVRALQDRIASMEKAAADGTAEITRLQQVADDLAAKLQQAQQTIQEMSQASLAGSTPAPTGGAGPKK